LSAGARLGQCNSRGGRRWLDDVISGRVTTVAELCARGEMQRYGKVNMTISLAFLAPNLVKAAVEGRLAPAAFGVERLRDPPTEWSRQFEALGLNPGVAAAPAPRSIRSEPSLRPGTVLVREWGPTVRSV